MEIITGVERRRRWPLAEKLRIVSETEQAGTGIAEIARRYEISRGLLWNWRSQVRRGVLRPEPTSVFVPVQVLSTPTPPDWPEPAQPAPAARSEPAIADSKIEITLADGTAIRVGHDISSMTLRRVVSALRR
jgi:transposase-like protein